jgi:hypothetical protein
MLKYNRVILNYCRAFRGYNFQTGSNKIKLITGYESVTQKVLFGNTTRRINVLEKL